MKTVLKAIFFVLALVILSLAQQPSAPAQQSGRPQMSEFKTYEAYIEALVDWKMHQPEPKVTTLAGCKFQLKNADTKTYDLTQGYETLKTANDNLRAEVKTLSDSNADMRDKYEKLHAAGMQVLQFNQQLITEYGNLSAKHNDLVDRYNNLLQQANNAIQTANARLAAQNRIANALAIYGAML